MYLKLRQYGESETVGCLLEGQEKEQITQKKTPKSQLPHLPSTATLALAVAPRCDKTDP